MTAEEGNPIRKILDALISRDIEKALSHYTDDCIYEDVALGRVNRGKQELRDFYQEWFKSSPDVNLDLRAIIS